MSVSELHTPQEWRTGLREIRDNAQATMGGKVLETADVTTQVLDLANGIWGPHDVSPDMKIEVSGQTPHMQAPYLYVRDRVAKSNSYDIGTAQGGYIDPKTGLFVIQKGIFVYDWLEDRKLPEESAFNFAREVTKAQFGEEALMAALPAIREQRASHAQSAARAEEQRAKKEARNEKLQQLIASDPILFRLTEGMSDSDRGLLADQLRRLSGGGMMVWDANQWNITSNAPAFEEAKALIEENGGSSDKLLVACPGPGAICELKDFARIRDRQYIDFSGTYADHAILRWVSSQAGNHGNRVVTSIGHTLSSEEKSLVEAQFGIHSSFLGRAPDGRMVWDSPQKPGYMFTVIEDVPSEYDDTTSQQVVGTLYIPTES